MEIDLLFFCFSSVCVLWRKYRTKLEPELKAGCGVRLVGFQKVRTAGIEPATHGFGIRYSTTELSGGTDAISYLFTEEKLSKNH